MAAPIAACTVAGTRRAVIRSEKFMEWQRELSCSRAVYGGRKRNEDSETLEISANKRLNGKRQSNDNNAAKLHKVLEERDEESVETLENQRTKLKQQQQSRDNRVQKGDYLGSKMRKTDFLDPSEAQGSDLHRCKRCCFQARCFRHKQELQSQQVQTNLKTLNRNRQNLMQKPFPLTKKTADQAPQLLKSTIKQENSPLVYCQNSRSIKRSKRFTRRLSLEEPLPPPLKLPKLHLVLTCREIQEDWIKITGHKYSGKPRKSTLAQRGFGLCTSLTRPSSIHYLNDP